MELKLVSEKYIRNEQASEAVFAVLKDFIEEGNLLKDDFVFEEEIVDYVKSELKTELAFFINDDGYYIFKDYLITFSKINKIVNKVLIFECPADMKKKFLK